VGNSSDRRKERRLAVRIVAMLPAPLFSKKPIDTWLQLLGIGVGIALFLLTKTPTVVIVCLLLMFGCFAHPVWNFWWIEKSRIRQVSCVAALLICLVLFGWTVWPMRVPVNRSDPDIAKTKTIKQSLRFMDLSRPYDLSREDLAVASLHLADEIDVWAKDYYYEFQHNTVNPMQGANKLSDKEVFFRWRRQEKMIMDKYLLGFEKTYRSDAKALRIELLRRLPREEALSHETLAAEASFSLEGMTGWMITSTASELRRLGRKLEATFTH
jgi:hypothetical protein